MNAQSVQPQKLKRVPNDLEPPPPRHTPSVLLDTTNPRKRRGTRHTLTASSRGAGTGSPRTSEYTSRNRSTCSRTQSSYSTASARPRVPAQRARRDRSNDARESRAAPASLVREVEQSPAETPRNKATQTPQTALPRDVRCERLRQSALQTATSVSDRRSVNIRGTHGHVEDRQSFGKKSSQKTSDATFKTSQTERLATLVKGRRTRPRRPQAQKDNEPRLLDEAIRIHTRNAAQKQLNRTKTPAHRAADKSQKETETEYEPWQSDIRTRAPDSLAPHTERTSRPQSNKRQTKDKTMTFLDTSRRTSKQHIEAKSIHDPSPNISVTDHSHEKGTMP